MVGHVVVVIPRKNVNIGFSAAILCSIIIVFRYPNPRTFSNKLLFIILVLVIRQYLPKVISNIYSKHDNLFIIV